MIRMTETDIAQLKLEEELIFADSYSRLPLLLDYGPWSVGCDKWLELLGKKWSACDNIGLHAQELIDAVEFAAESMPVMQMMNETEQAVFASLPETITVYRGCYENNKWGFSWSLEREVANRFPFLTRYRQQGRPLLIKATIEKSKVAAVKLDREESEVIMFDRPKCISIAKARVEPGRQSLAVS